MIIFVKYIYIFFILSSFLWFILTINNILLFLCNLLYFQNYLDDNLLYFISLTLNIILFYCFYLVNNKKINTFIKKHKFLMNKVFCYDILFTKFLIIKIFIFYLFFLFTLIILDASFYKLIKFLCEKILFSI